MAQQHILIRQDGEESEIETKRFTMKLEPNLPELPSLAETPCWYCGELIHAGQDYYVDLVWHQRAFSPASALVHAVHTDRI